MVARDLAKLVYEKYIDAKTQVPYWHNPRSGATVWVKPSALGPEDVQTKAVAVDPKQEYVVAPRRAAAFHDAFVSQPCGAGWCPQIHATLLHM